MVQNQKVIKQGGRKAHTVLPHFNHISKKYMKKRERLTYLLFALCVLDIIDFDNLGVLDVGVLITGGILAAFRIYDFIGGSHGKP